jgi:hypothetical protein
MLEAPPAAFGGGAPELRAVLEPAVPTIVEAAIAAISDRERAPAPARRALERNLRRGLTDAVDRWFDPGRAEPHSDLHYMLGRAQARAGRSLDELMSFYRIAGQTMWRRLTELAEDGGAEPQDVYRLAETGFGCVDELSTQAAAGFADEQSHRSGAAHSRRSELMRLLLDQPQPPRAQLDAAARASGLELSATLAVFVGEAEHFDAFARAAREQLLLGPRGGEFVGALLDPDGPGRRRALATAAEQAAATLALGPVVPLSGARASLARARSVLSLLRAQLVAAAPLAEAESYDLPLFMSADPQLASALVARRLAPLEGLSPATSAKLAATLEAWLRTPGQRKIVAHALGVHPQTVRYRMARLRELFGPDLDDPDRSFELQLALRLRPYAGLAGPAAA